MDSSSDAFSKFSTWKKLRTPLRVTVIILGKATEVLRGRIDALDSDASQVGLSLGDPFGPVFDVEGAVFSVEALRIVATRSESDWIVFEEELAIHHPEIIH